MILTSVLSKVVYKIFLTLFSLYISTFGGTVYTPSTEAPIKPSGNDAALVFAAIADPQVSNYMYERYTYFDGACKDLRNMEGVDMLLMAGDIAENGLQEEYQLVYDNLGGLDLRYIACVGNHDIRLKPYSVSTKRFNSFVNALNSDEDATSFHHSETVNGYKFIVLGSDRTEFEESYLSEEQLSWLDSELAGQDGAVTFVLVHQPLKLTHGLPKVWNSPIDAAGSIGDQSDDLKAILNKYDNVILLTGHEHTGFGEYTYEKIDNFHSYNLPSLCCNNADGEYNEHGLGCIVEVYDTHVLFRARDMLKGEWLPDYDVDIVLT